MRVAKANRAVRARVATGILLAAAALCLLGCRQPGGPMSDPARRSGPPEFFLGGIQVHEADNSDWFDALESQSMNSVQVTEYARHGGWDTDDLSWHEPDARVLEEIRGAERRGLAVVYVCRVHLDPAAARNEFLWHGMIRPRTDELVASWFERYGAFVVERAELAEREGVDVFMIGSEMNALATTIAASQPPELEEYYLNEEKQEQRRTQVLAQERMIDAEREGFDSVEGYIDARITAERAWAETATGGSAESLEAINAHRERLRRHWEALIEKVRHVYSGPVGYAANFDQYREVGFWPTLDVMGINAYFELRDRVLDDESEERLYPLLLDGWRGVLGKIGEFREANRLGDKPLIFTEMGFTRRARSTLQPWADEGFALIPASKTLADGSLAETGDTVVVWREQPIKLEERAWAVRALWQAHAELERPFLSGILYWKLSSHDYHFDDEAFMVHVGAGADDPILPELRRFLAES
ncbi:MAG: hypothetical protein GY719_08210 [bacterium]|nr:hypothetical protein [bacterium]